MQTNSVNCSQVPEIKHYKDLRNYLPCIYSEDNLNMNEHTFAHYFPTVTRGSDTETFAYAPHTYSWIIYILITINEMDSGTQCALATPIPRDRRSGMFKFQSHFWRLLINKFTLAYARGFVLLNSHVVARFVLIIYYKEF